MADPDVTAGGATTLLEVLAEFQADGYTTDFFVADDDGNVVCGSCQCVVPPTDLTIERSRRLEGASDPADEALVLAVACADCGARGTLILRYGPEAGAGESIVMRTVRDDRGDADEPYGPE